MEGSDPVNQFNQTSWVAIVTPTDRPKSVRNLSAVEVVGGVLCCHFAFSSYLEFSVSVRACVIGMSKIYPFFSCDIDLAF